MEKETLKSLMSGFPIEERRLMWEILSEEFSRPSEKLDLTGLEKHLWKISESQKEISKILMAMNQAIQSIQKKTLKK